ncbi:hypothetical protein [Haloarchaeobius sp. DT45]|uniref:hypothetical protein n=1 Tax=Haloarchaeobius sp. DT45 TaxID=3446116 RepID=UPI003F6B57CB
MGSDSESGIHSKKEIIINAWLLAPEAPVKPVAEAVEKVSKISYEYVRRIINEEIKTGAISREEIEEAADLGLQANLRDHLQAMEGTEGIEMELRTSPPKGWAEDSGGEKSELQREIEALDMPKRVRLINVWQLEPDVDYADAADAVGCTKEYARQVFSKLGDGEISEGMTQDALDSEVQELFEARLIELGVIVPQRDELEQGYGTTVSVPDGAVVPAEDVVRVREAVDLLRREAVSELEVESNPSTVKKKFVTEEVLRLLDGALEEAFVPE